MIPSAINTLFGNATTPSAAKNTQSTPAGGMQFGQMLNREMDNRQNAPRTESPTPPGASSARNDNRADGPNAAAARQSRDNGVDSAAVRARQNEQRAQDRKNDGPQDAAAAPQKTDTSATRTAADDMSKAKSSGSDDDTTTNKAAATDAGDVSESPTITPASAELLALVNSLAPKSAAPDAATQAAAGETAVAIDGKFDARSGAGKATRIGLAAATDAASASDAAATDPAFDAMLAQAAQSAQGRENGKADLAAKPAGANALLEAAIDGRSNPNAQGTQLLSDAASGAKAALVAGPDAVISAVTAQSTQPVDTAALAGVSALATSASSNVLHGAGSPASETLTPHVGTPGWDNALGQKVVWMAVGAEQSASLTLNPPDLGPLQVVINVNNSHAEATFTAAQPEVRQALEAALPRLKEMLSDAGISLGQASVNAGSPNQQGAADQQAARANGRRGTDSRNSDAADAADPVIRTRTQVIRGGNGLVDTFA